VQKKIVLNRTLCLLNFFNILKIKINEFNNIFIYFFTNITCFKCNVGSFGFGINLRVDRCMFVGCEELEGISL
jgi:hypothetical protein